MTADWFEVRCAGPSCNRMIFQGTKPGSQMIKSGERLARKCEKCGTVNTMIGSDEPLGEGHESPKKATV